MTGLKLLSQLVFCLFVFARFCLEALFTVGLQHARSDYNTDRPISVQTNVDLMTSL